MTKTYNLNQWEPTDEIRVEDFNADNAAVDAALAELNAAVTEASSVNGNFAMTKSSAIKVNLGFRPQLVLMVGQGNNGYGLAVLMDGISFYAGYDNSTYNMNAGSCSAVVSSTGFTVPANCSYFNDIAGRKCFYTVVR